MHNITEQGMVKESISMLKDNEGIDFLSERREEGINFYAWNEGERAYM